MTSQNRPSALRSPLRRLAIAGTASLAAVFVVAPVAVADDATSSEPTEESTGAATSAETGAEQGTGTEETPAEDETAEETPADDAAEEEAQPPAAPETEAVVDPAPATRSGTTEKPGIAAAVEEEEEVEADFGFQKFRVGVQIADGSFVDGATTVGSTIQITYTDQEGEETVDTCTTQAGTDDEETTSYCLGEELPDVRGLSAKVRKAVSVGQDDENRPEQYFYAEPGETVTIKQLTAGPGLVKAGDVVTIEPCEYDTTFFGSGSTGAPCTDGPVRLDGENFPRGKITKVLFDNTNTLPKANPDKATTDEGEAVTIDVLDNDDTRGAQTTDLEIADEPGDGDAEVLGEPANPSARAVGAGSLRIRYTPDANFTGRDTFRYTLSTANGSSTTTVAVTVKGGTAAVSDTTTTTTTATTTSSALPNTGGQSAELLGLGALMLAGGGALTVRARRRIGVDVD